MLGIRQRPPKRSSLMQRYGVQLGHIISHQRTEQALIAARHEAERAAESARVALLNAEAANRAKREFLTNMSHELRTPLNAIIGFSDVMRNQMLGPLESSPQYLDYAEDINSAGEHLLGVINSVLDMAKIESGKLDLEEKVFSLEYLIDASIAMLRERAADVGVRVERSLPVALPRMYGDDKKVRQIILNLLSNAIKFTPEGGKVTVTAGLVTGGIMIRVSDVGVGIAESDLKRAMMPFGQVDSSLSRSHEGTGLGLPISKALAELHSATFDIVSEFGRGTTVTVHFPAERTVGDLGEEAIG